jgi:predicted nucleic acid-binding protein
MRNVTSDESGAGSPASSEPPEVSQTLYVESSALLRILLEGDSQLEQGVGAFSDYFTSALTMIEVPRALARAGRESRLMHDRVEDAHRRFANFVRACNAAEITTEVRSRAALEFPLEPVRSLDAIHLATIEIWSQTIGALAVASTDERVRRNARALGYDVIPLDEEGPDGRHAPQGDAPLEEPGAAGREGRGARP